MNYEDAINDYTLPLEEQFYNPNNYQTFLSNEHYHHQDKGCDTEIILHQSPRGDKKLNKICHTHNVNCSKTGWELGWYMGTYNRNEYGNCQICGCVLTTRNKLAKYCKSCSRELNNKRSYKKFLEKKYEKKITNVNS
jgi:hypothetical protein